MDEVEAFIHEVYRLCLPIGMRAEIAIVQSWHETAQQVDADAEWEPWASYWWQTRLNRPTRLDPDHFDTPVELQDVVTAARELDLAPDQNWH